MLSRMLLDAASTALDVSDLKTIVYVLCGVVAGAGGVIARMAQVFWAASRGHAAEVKALQDERLKDLREHAAATREATREVATALAAATHKMGESAKAVEEMAESMRRYEPEEYDRGPRTKQR